MPLNEIEQFYDLTTDIDKDDINSLPQETILYQNYPNPFNPVTTISFAVSGIENAFNAPSTTLKIYDVLGNEITTLINNKFMSPGRYQVNFDASHLSSGVYFYQLRVGNNFQIKKMLVLK